MRKNNIFLVFALFVLSITLSGCILEVEDYTFVFKNADTEDCHMYNENETIGPSNKLSPGSSRSVESINAPDRYLVEIFVGRDGNVIASGYANPDKEHVINITWDGSVLSIKD